MSKKVNWKLSAWNIVPIIETNTHTTWASNDTKFEGTATINNNHNELLQQLSIDSCIDLKMWEEIKDGNISKFSTHQPGNKSRA